MSVPFDSEWTKGSSDNVGKRNPSLVASSIVFAWVDAILDLGFGLFVTMIPPLAMNFLSSLAFLSLRRWNSFCKRRSAKVTGRFASKAVCNTALWKSGEPLMISGWLFIVSAASISAIDKVVGEAFSVTSTPLAEFLIEPKSSVL